jgi:2-dehydro-3-deoxyphosphogluconate aldolase/(4S)-4-hydroxy-2-oxoglutarate aldolase
MVDLLAHLKVSRVVAIVRAAQSGVAADVAIALVDAGIDAVEIPLTTPDALAAIRVVRERAGDRAIVGAGTVLTVADVRAVVAAGADFAVTPAVTHAVAEAALVGLPVLAGAYTPTEVAQAMAVGATAVKLFPATTGGVAHLKALRDPFPAVPFVPVGGVTAELASAYLTAGAVAVGVGGPLVGDAVQGGSLADLRERAAAFVRLRERP